MALRLLEEKMRSINREDYRPTMVETFGNFADRWMGTVMIHLAESTQQEERRRIEKQLKPVFGMVPMQQITAEMVQAWISSLPYSPKTIRNLKGTLSTIWTKAKDWDYVKHDPFKGLRLPAKGISQVYQFSAEEMMAIINEAKGWYKTFFRLLAQTGMRPGEAFALRPQDLEGRTIHVRQAVWRGKVKNSVKTKDSVRDISIADALASELRAHMSEAGPNKHGLIFLNKFGRPVNASHFVDKVLNPILDRLGIRAKIKELGIRGGNYAFRHGNITELRRSGVPLKTIQARVGHAVGSHVTDLHYVHAVSADDHAAADLIDALLSPKQDGESVQ
ncbi:MAG TPA: site-specific integrase [Terracidiphilus sp.]|jgi:integrase